MFRPSHRIIEKEEGPNDGLVSVESSMWGDYKGTLEGVSHLDLIVRILGPLWLRVVVSVSRASLCKLA